MKRLDTGMLVGVATLALAACDGGTTANTADVSPPTASASAAPQPAATLRLAGDGLALGDERIAFGTQRATALAAISRGMGG